LVRLATDATGTTGEMALFFCCAFAQKCWFSINSTDLDEQEQVLNTICSPGGFFYQQFADIVPPGVSFGSQSNNVFEQVRISSFDCSVFLKRNEKLSDAFMRSGVYAVEYLLQSGVKVNVYSGQVWGIGVCVSFA
jgi:hypothetical protein